jgi:hypothetical protein
MSKTCNRLMFSPTFFASLFSNPAPVEVASIARVGGRSAIVSAAANQGESIEQQ